MEPKLLIANLQNCLKIVRPTTRARALLPIAGVLLGTLFPGGSPLSATQTAQQASATCGAPALISPSSQGEAGQTLAQNYDTLVTDIHDSPSTRRLAVGDKVLQVPPWFTSPTDCTESSLHNGTGAIDPPLASPTLSHYLVAADELSELAIITAMGPSDARMLEIHNTIRVLQSSKFPGLPCWIAEVNDTAIACRSQDSASDATSRFGLAYFLAASNTRFSEASRSLYREAAHKLSYAHLKYEYAEGCFLSSVTGRRLCHWIGGGAETAASGVANLEMWIGYFPDVVRLLLAAYNSTRDPEFLSRATDVVDQFLSASEFTGSHLSIGRFNFRWDTSGKSVTPRPGNPYFWAENRAWDDVDAPRALWIGDVLRAYQLATQSASLPSPYSSLSDWVKLLQANGTQTAQLSCIQYNHDGSVVPGNCGSDYFYIGLAAGLLTFQGTDLLEPRLREALRQYGWSTTHTWNAVSCFGIYRGVRPVKALATAIGLDSSAFGCPLTIPTCAISDSTLCLAQDRFRVEATWRTADGNTGPAHAVQLTADTGYFWFFAPTNIELIVKVLNACGAPFDHFWVFSSGLTNVQVDLQVRDTLRDLAKSYHNPLNTPYGPILDTSAFATCP